MTCADIVVVAQLAGVKIHPGSVRCHRELHEDIEHSRAARGYDGLETRRYTCGDHEVILVRVRDQPLRQALRRCAICRLEFMSTGLATCPRCRAHSRAWYAKRRKR